MNFQLDPPSLNVDIDETLMWLDDITPEDMNQCWACLTDKAEEDNAFAHQLGDIVGNCPVAFLLQECREILQLKNGGVGFLMDGPTPMRLELVDAIIKNLKRDITSLVLDGDRQTAFIKTTVTLEDLCYERDIQVLFDQCRSCSTKYGKYFNCEQCQRQDDDLVPIVINHRTGTVKTMQGLKLRSDLFGST
jgi:hypothetical protein